MATIRKVGAVLTIVCRPCPYGVIACRLKTSAKKRVDLSVTNLAVDAWLPVPEAALDRRPEVEAMTLGCLDAPDLAVASRDTAVSRTHTAGNGSNGSLVSPSARRAGEEDLCFAVFNF